MNESLFPPEPRQDVVALPIIWVAVILSLLLHGAALWGWHVKPPELDKTEPEHVAAVDKILKACQKHNVIPGIQCGSGKAAAKAVEKGFRLVTFTKDSAVLPSFIDKELVAARGDAGAPVKERGYT